MRWQQGENVRISPKATINVTEHFEIGDGSVINDYAKIEGRSVIIGREAWIHEYSWIGGGSCFEETSELIAGDFLHLGRFAHINTACRVKIWHEVGIGHQSNIWTHGAYAPYDWGYPFQFAPVEIRHFSWLPHAWVNPGVTIGKGVMVAAMSLVNKDLPDFCFAAGIPVEIKKENAYPKEEVNFNLLVTHLRRTFKKDFEFKEDGPIFRIGDTFFSVYDRKIVGPVTGDTERFRNLLRRAGIRFRYYSHKGKNYVEWEDDGFQDSKFFKGNR